MGLDTTEQLSLFMRVGIGMCLVAQSCLTLCDPMDCSPPGSSVPGDSLGKNTRVGYHALFQGISPTQGLNPGLPHCRRILSHLSHRGSTHVYTCWSLSHVRRLATPWTVAHQPPLSMGFSWLSPQTKSQVCGYLGNFWMWSWYSSTRISLCVVFNLF